VFQLISRLNRCVETLTGNGNYFFRNFCPVVAFETVQKNVRLRVNKRQDCRIYMRKNGMYCGNVEIITINTIF
jgi:hypothetical protein